MALNLNDNPELQAISQNLDIKNNLSVQATLQEMEVERKRLVNEVGKSGLFIFLSLLLLVVGLLKFSLPMWIYILPVTGFIYGCVQSGKTSPKLLQFKNAYKENVMMPMLKTIDQSLVLQPNSGISRSDFINSLLFNKYPHLYHSEDYVWGKIDKTAFYFSEVNATYVKKSDKRDLKFSIFKGIIFRADFNKNFEGITILRANILTALQHSHYEGGAQFEVPTAKIEMENITFNDRFVLKSTNEVEARYLLSPVMMEKLIELDKKSKYRITVTFVRNSIYIAFPRYEQFFEPQINKSLLDSKTFERDLSIVRFMCQIIKELGLNTRIWGKD